MGDKWSLPAAGCRDRVIVEGSKGASSVQSGPCLSQVPPAALPEVLKVRPLRKPVRRWKPVMSKFFLTDRLAWLSPSP